MGSDGPWLEVPLKVPHAVHGIIEPMIWQGLKVQWCEQLAIRIILLSDADDVAGIASVHDLVLVPRSMVLNELPRALPAKEVGDVLLVDVLQECLQRFATDDLDLRASLLVEPALDHGPGRGEGPGRVDNAKLSELLRIVVLRDLGGSLDETIHASRQH